MTPFLRFALLACGTLWAVVLAVIYRYFGGLGMAVFVAGVAVLVAVGATLETARSEVDPDEASLDEALKAPIRRRDRREIERSARRAADEQ